MARRIRKDVFDLLSGVNGSGAGMAVALDGVGPDFTGICVDFAQLKPGSAGWCEFFRTRFGSILSELAGACEAQATDRETYLRRLHRDVNTYLRQLATGSVPGVVADNLQSSLLAFGPQSKRWIELQPNAADREKVRLADMQMGLTTCVRGLESDGFARAYAAVILAGLAQLIPSFSLLRCCGACGRVFIRRQRRQKLCSHCSGTYEARAKLSSGTGEDDHSAGTSAPEVDSEPLRHAGPQQLAPTGIEADWMRLKRAFLSVDAGSFADLERFAYQYARGLGLFEEAVARGHLSLDEFLERARDLQSWLGRVTPLTRNRSANMLASDFEELDHRLWTKGPIRVLILTPRLDNGNGCFSPFVDISAGDIYVGYDWQCVLPGCPDFFESLGGILADGVLAELARRRVATICELCGNAYTSRKRKSVCSNHRAEQKMNWVFQNRACRSGKRADRYHSTGQ